MMKQRRMVLLEDLEKPAILLGNGLNLLANDHCPGMRRYESWQGMLELIAEGSAVNGGINIESLCNDHSITLPELFSVLAFREETEGIDFITSLFRDVIERSEAPINYSEAIATVVGAKKADARFKRMIASLVNCWKPHKECHGAFCKYVSEFRGAGIPVLTTNYDSLLEDALLANRPSFGVREKQVASGIRYLDKQYFAIEDINPEERAKRFSIWHIHGRADRPNTIKISHSDYANMLAHYREAVKKGKLHGELEGWLPLFFGSDLIILGLRLDPVEYPLRWLLMERMKSIRSLLCKPRTVFACIDEKGKRDEKDKNKGRRFFFESIGVEVDDSSDSYEELYSRFGVAL